MKRSTLSQISFLLLIANFYAHAQVDPKLDPVSVSIKRLNQNKPDPVELSYVGMRCGALNTMIGLAFEYQGSGSPESKQTEMLYKADGDSFKNVGFYMGITNKISNEYMLKQFDYFLRLYGDDWVKSQKLNNNPWNPFILSEVKSCQTVIPMFTGLSRAIDKANPR